MSTSWCPECRSEYREGVTVCADCGAALVPDPPPPPTTHRQVREHREIAGPFLPEEDLIEVARIEAFEAEVVAAQLRRVGIPVAVFGVGTAGALPQLRFAEGSRVMVRRVDADSAATIIEELFAGDELAVPVDDDELSALAEQSTGYTDPSTGAIV